MIRITGMDTKAGRMAEMAYRADRPMAWCDRCDILGPKGKKCQRCGGKFDWKEAKK